jgi:hypothetical protein
MSRFTDMVTAEGHRIVDLIKRAPTLPKAKKQARWYAIAGAMTPADQYAIYVALADRLTGTPRRAATLLIQAAIAAASVAALEETRVATERAFRMEPTPERLQCLLSILSAIAQLAPNNGSQGAAVGASTTR